MHVVFWRSHMSCYNDGLLYVFAEDCARWSTVNDPCRVADFGSSAVPLWAGPRARCTRRRSGDGATGIAASGSSVRLAMNCTRFQCIAVSTLRRSARENAVCQRLTSSGVV